MDDPRQDAWRKCASRNNYPESENPLKYEIFDPPFAKEVVGFTRGKEYPIYEEKVVGRYCQQDIPSLFEGVEYRTINDDGEMVYKNAQYFFLRGHVQIGYTGKSEEWEKLMPYTNCNLRDAYKALRNHTPFEEYMSMIPTWRVLAGLTEGSLDLTQQLKEMDKELKSFIRSANWMRDKIQEVLRRKDNPKQEQNPIFAWEKSSWDETIERREHFDEWLKQKTAFTPVLMATEQAPIKYETFDPPFMTTGKQTNGFTVGKEYPVYSEVISDTTITEPKVEVEYATIASGRSVAIKETEDDDRVVMPTFVANHTVMYLTRNDYDEMVLKSSAYFKLYAHADLYEKEKQEEMKAKEPIAYYLEKHMKLVHEIFGWAERHQSPVKEYLEQHQKLVDEILNKKEE